MNKNGRIEKKEGKEKSEGLIPQKSGFLIYFATGFRLAEKRRCCSSIFTTNITVLTEDTRQSKRRKGAKNPEYSPTVYRIYRKKKQERKQKPQNTPKLKRHQVELSN